MENNYINKSSASSSAEQPSKAKIILNVVAIVLCVVLLPILVFNCTLIIKGMLNPDEVPSIGKSIPLIVVTESMDPTIKAGDLIICKEIDAKDVKEGDVISFFDPAGNGTSVVTHRVNSIITDSEGNRSFKTQGDNNNIEDRIAVPEDNLIGVWTEKRIGVIGYVVLFAQKPIGLLVCIFVPVALFVAYEVFQRFKKSKQKQGDIYALRAELEALKAQNSSKEDNNSNGEN